MAVHFLGVGGGNRCAVGIHDALGNGDDAAAIFFIGFGYVSGKSGHVERTLRQINQVRSRPRIGARQRRGRRQEAGMTAHDNIDLHAWQRRVVQVVAHECLRHKLGRTGKAGGVIVFAQVVVDCLGDMKTVQLVTGLLGFFVDDMRGLSRVVAPNIEEVAHAMLLELRKNLGAIFWRGFLAH